jgi:hypothetical protein
VVKFSLRNVLKQPDADTWVVLEARNGTQCFLTHRTKAVPSNAPQCPPNLVRNLTCWTHSRRVSLFSSQTAGICS